MAPLAVAAAASLAPGSAVSVTPAAATSGPAAVSRAPVLGKRGLMGRYGRGWGKVRPSVIFNGGDPSGLVERIHWRSWGGRTAIGTGLNAIFKPSGGYYRQRVHIRLRASHLGKCSPHGPVAYRRLSFRAPSRPGGRLGKWTLWSGLHSICRTPY